MSARNGQRARFHRNRKRRVVRAMHLREVMAGIKQQKADTPAAVAASAPAPAPARTKRGPALSES